MNLLVGANNVGKTNLCHALRFVSLTAQMPLDDAAAACTAEPWNLLNVYITEQTISLGVICELQMEDDLLRFTYDLSLSSTRGSRAQARRPRFVVSSETLRVDGAGFRNVTLLENHQGQVRLLHEGRFQSHPEVRADRKPEDFSEPFVETTAPSDATMLFRLYDLETNQRSNLFKRFLTSWGYYKLDPNRLRGNQARGMDYVLESAGSNLASVVFTLHNAKPRLEKKLIEAVKILEPRLDVFTFLTPDPEHVYMFFEDRQGTRFGLDNVSDGTLRYLAISYLILSAAEVMEERPGPRLTLIEEPENGIFVGHLKTLFERIDPSGSAGQFVLTSHNPYFIDLFDKALDGLFLIKNGGTHSQLVKPDVSAVKERLGTFSLGELHFRGLLE